MRNAKCGMRSKGRFSSRKGAKGAKKGSRHFRRILKGVSWIAVALCDLSDLGERSGVGLTQRRQGRKEEHKKVFLASLARDPDSSSRKDVRLRLPVAFATQTGADTHRQAKDAKEDITHVRKYEGTKGRCHCGMRISDCGMELSAE